MIISSWPIGTCLFAELPASVRATLGELVRDDGVVLGIMPDAFEIQRTATEGPYVSIAGYKVRVMIDLLGVVRVL